MLKKIPSRVWYLLCGLLIGLLLTSLSIYAIGFDITKYKVNWDGTINKYIFLTLPWILLLAIFILRKKLNMIPLHYKNITYITLGLFAFFWELDHDLTTLFLTTDIKFEAYNLFISGFGLCRMNIYIVGVFLMFRKLEMLKWVVATSLFGGLSALFGEYDHTANIHSLITHAIILMPLPAFALAISGKNYTLRNILHTHIFSLTIVGVMLIVNYIINDGWIVTRGHHLVISTAGELTKTNMSDNPIVGKIPWPFNAVVWIMLVILIAWLYFGIYRLIIWRTYQKDLTFRQTFTQEFGIDRLEWYGFKLWGKHNWPQRWLLRAKL